MKDRAVRAFSLITFQSRWGWPQVSLAGLTYFIATVQDGGKTGVLYFGRSCQKATALAAATFRESTWWDIGIFSV